jgi:hypothetical protein
MDREKKGENLTAMVVRFFLIMGNSKRGVTVNMFFMHYFTQK